MKKIIRIFSLTAIFIISTIIILGWDYYNSNYYNQFGWKSCGGGTIKNDVIYFNNSFSSLTTRWLKIYDNTELAGYILFCYDGYLWIYSCREKDRSHKGFGKYKAVVYAKGLKKNMDKHSPDSLKRKE